MGPRRSELSHYEWSIVQLLLPNKARGAPRVDDRRVLNGIYWRLRTDSPWTDMPERYGPPTTYRRDVGPGTPLLHGLAQGVAVVGAIRKQGLAVADCRQTAA